jgi:mannose-6-phosphate isomerase-like protein (cupin superfamily)
LSPNLSGSLELLSCRFPPGGSSGEEPYTHAGEEAGAVILGRLEPWVNGRSVLLEAGDSFGFQSTLAHRYRNPGPDETEVIWAITPPSFDMNRIANLWEDTAVAAPRTAPRSMARRAPMSW